MLGHSIVSQHFMEPEGSIPNSQELSTCSSILNQTDPVHITTSHPRLLKHGKKIWDHCIPSQGDCFQDGSQTEYVKLAFLFFLPSPGSFRYTLIL
jgi:hypothetical protein